MNPSNPIAALVPPQVMQVWYTNWRGERALRTIKPLHVFFGSNQWHPERQWLLLALDLEKQEERTFAMKNFEECPLNIQKSGTDQADPVCKQYSPETW